MNTKLHTLFLPLFLLASLSLLSLELTAASSATIRTVERDLLTYDFSAAREVPEMTKFYPYHRYDGYSDKGVMQSWEMIELSNDFITLWVMPAVGGKVWGAIDNRTGQEFIYFNHVVKFRDVAMRGPWTSGGIEHNFGIIGHAPWTSDLVDFRTRTNEDGSVTCVVGSSDLTLETEWRVEITLPADKAYFETNVLWFNGSGLDKPAYQWMNTGIKTQGDLQYSYPGHYHLGHSGEIATWPTEEGHPIDWYEKNDFGGAKSYHVAGSYSDFWGAYWHDDSFGMGHVSPYADKPGRKVWIWGLSDAGMIWENLLTDSDGQYSEVQSGFHLNQSNPGSSLTPYKHTKLTPYSTQSWNEYWFPVQGTDGIRYSSKELAFNLIAQGEQTLLKLYAVSPLRGEVRLVSGDQVLATKAVALSPTELDSVAFAGAMPESFTLYVGENKIYDTQLNEQEIQRPKFTPEQFDNSSLYGRYLQAREQERQGYLIEAQKRYESVLDEDNYYLPALVRLGSVEIQQGNTTRAYEVLERALSIDTYDGGANYLWGLLHFDQQGPDAYEGFSLATRSSEYRGAAYTALAQLCVRDGYLSEAQAWVDRALGDNNKNVTALQLDLLLKRLAGDTEATSEATSEATTEATSEAIDRLLALDALNYMAEYERLLLSGNTADARADFQAGINSAFTVETYVILADFYTQLGRYTEAEDVLSLAPSASKISYWSAYLAALQGDTARAEAMLSEAVEAPLSMLFPGRRTESKLFDWAYETLPTWQTAYLKAIVCCRTNKSDEALELLMGYNKGVDFYPYFALRASLQSDTALAEADLKSTNALAPELPYTIQLLAKHYAATDNYAASLPYLEAAMKRNAQDYTLGMALAEAYSKLGRYSEAIRWMSSLNVLPFEGAQASRALWRESNLWLAGDYMKSKQVKKAIKAIDAAREWPVNLGVGSPYADQVDERVEDWMEIACLKGVKGSDARVAELKGRIMSYADSVGYTAYRSADLLTALLLSEAGEGERAERFLSAWFETDGDAQPARWSKALFEGRFADAQAVAEEADEEVEFNPYQVLFVDRDYPLLKVLFHGQK